MERNIKLMYIISSLMWMRFFIPILALFYIASQVSLSEFSIIMGIFALATLLLEIPSGVIADLLGKKKTLIIARFLYIIEIFILAFFNGFWFFLVAKIISGIGVSLSSGTDQALLYDTLKKIGREKEHKTISGNIYTITNISMAFVFIIGSYLFTINYKLPALVSLPLVSLGFILTFFLREPYTNDKKLNISNSILHLKEGFKYFWNHKFIKFLIFYSLPIGAIISIILSLSSAYFENISIPVSLIGLIAFIASMIVAFSSKKTANIERRIGIKFSLLLIPILLVLALFLMSLMFKFYGVLFYFIISFISGFYSIVVNHYTNLYIQSSHRATMLSIKNFFINLGVFILFYVISYLQKSESFAISIKFLLIFSLIYFIILLIYSKRISVLKSLLNQ